jgi:UPF0755 protein
LKKGLKWGAVVLGLLVALTAAGWAALNHMVRPQELGPSRFIRYDSAPSLETALTDLETQGVLRNARLSLLRLNLTRRARSLRAGTFEVNPGMTLEQVVDALRTPVRRMVRVPEGWWIGRVAQRLEREGVANAEDYIRLASEPSRFKDDVSIPLPEKSLEGYLYPDTYDFPPLLGAENAIRMQLRAFEEKVATQIEDQKKLQRALVVASMVELEAALDRERPVIAGVIENRLRKGMRLEIDATVLYALGEWKNLGPGVVRTVKSPFNTYLNSGLPPGPIGSPSAKSIQAALAPAKHDWLFYVARPDRSHIFAKTYPDHLKNIRVARAAWKKAREERDNKGR